MKKDNKWFWLIVVTFFIWLLVTFSIYTFYQKNIFLKNVEYSKDLNFAKSLLIDWIELIDWYSVSLKNNDSYNYWDDNIYSLSWNYIISYWDNWYELREWENQAFYYKWVEPFYRYIEVIDKWESKQFNIFIYKWDKYLTEWNYVLSNYSIWK